MSRYEMHIQEQNYLYHYSVVQRNGVNVLRGYSIPNANFSRHSKFIVMDEMSLYK